MSIAPKCICNHSPSSFCLSGIKECKNFKEEMSNKYPIGASAVWVKGQYDRLYDQVKSGKQTVCYMDYNWYREDLKKISRDICVLYPQSMHFMSRGQTHGGVSHMNGDKRQNFIELCKRMNIEWLDEQATTPNKDEAVEFAEWIREQGIEPTFNKKWVDFSKSKDNRYTTAQLHEIWQQTKK